MNELRRESVKSEKDGSPSIERNKELSKRGSILLKKLKSFEEDEHKPHLIDRQEDSKFASFRNLKKSIQRKNLGRAASHILEAAYTAQPAKREIRKRVKTSELSDFYNVAKQTG